MASYIMMFQSFSGVLCVCVCLQTSCLKQGLEKTEIRDYMIHCVPLEEMGK